MKINTSTIFFVFINNTTPPTPDSPDISATEIKEKLDWDCNIIKCKYKLLDRLYRIESNNLYFYLA